LICFVADVIYIYFLVQLKQKGQNIFV